MACMACGHIITTRYYSDMVQNPILIIGGESSVKRRDSDIASRQSGHKELGLLP